MSEGSPWTRPPEQPTNYRFTARLSDMLHGWLDGRRGIPALPDAVVGDAAGAADADGSTEGDGNGAGGAGESGGLDGDGVGADGAGGDIPADHVPPVHPGPGIGVLETPRIRVLSRQALERIRGEEISYRDECAVLKPQYARFLSERDALGGQLVTARERLERARQELTPADLASRRLAEKDAAARPDDLVRGRRRAEWERELAAAERNFNVIAERHMAAAREAVLRRDLIRDRAAVARAAAKRHSELAQRRIATYLQQLVRTHKQGRDLNMLIIVQPVGPELPEWATSAADANLNDEKGRP
jgi:hypothetical protein